MKRKLRAGMTSGLLAMAACVALHSPPSMAARDAQGILKETCQGCHTPEADKGLSRISHQRKTPKGAARIASALTPLQRCVPKPNAEP